MLVVVSWLQDYLKKNLSVTQITTAMETAGIEIEALETDANNETIINIKTAANRSDLQSLMGIAREVSAHTGVELSSVSDPLPFRSSKPTLFSNHIKALVPRYSVAKIILKQPVTASPAWLQRRLELSGIRPINNVVDITNYIMLAYGQSLHAFDADKVKGQLILRRAKKAEHLITLDGQTRLLQEGDLVIADHSGAIDLAGIMGGLSTEITATTTAILLTAPNFNGTAIRKTALRLGLRTEASARFERELPLQYQPLGLSRAIAMFRQLAEAKIERVEDEVSSLPSTVQIRVDSKRLSELAGITITNRQAMKHLTKLGFKTSIMNSTLKVKVPYWRPDIKDPADVLEEVIKLIGLDSLPATLPAYRLNEPIYDNYWPKLWQLRELMRGLGAFEVTTYPFVSEQLLRLFQLAPSSHLELKNPKSAEQTHLRSCLIVGLAQSLAANRSITADFSLFEIGRVFYPLQKSTQPQEVEKLAVITQQQDAYRDIKNTLDQLMRALHITIKLEQVQEHPFLNPARQLSIKVGNKSFGYIGELQPAMMRNLKIKKPVGYLEVGLEDVFNYQQVPQVIPLGRYQRVSRDVTVLVDRSVTWQELEQAVNDTRIGQASFVSDYYASQLGEAKKTITFSLTISPEKNLTDDEIDQRLNQVIAVLKTQIGAQL